LRRTQETGERQALIIEPTAWTQTAFLKSDPGKSHTEQVVGVGAREVLTHALQEEILSDGSVRNIQNYSSMDGLKRPEMTRQYDPAGNLVRLHRGGDDRSLTLDYDDIGRVTKVLTADGSSIHREYFGLSN
ncbi:RHS repeat domain-containing protein, partial [Pseudomonas viridiflava]